MLTPVFHPNIAPHAICIGDHWSAGESLSSLVTRIGEMLAYQSYNTKSPLNGEAAKWVDQNVERLPLDPVNMHLEDSSPPKPAAPPPFATPAPAARPSIAPPPLSSQAQGKIVTCPGCAAKIRVKPEQGQQVRCPRCRTIIAVPA
jgi:predicted Zn finger-like uncharacterized protein